MISSALKGLRMPTLQSMARRILARGLDVASRLDEEVATPARRTMPAALRMAQPLTMPEGSSEPSGLRISKYPPVSFFRLFGKRQHFASFRRSSR